MKPKASAGLLAAGVVLLAANLFVQASRPAEGGGGDPCPADLDNNGVVDAADFFVFLADFGPCPSSRVVSMDGIDEIADLERLVDDTREDCELLAFLQYFRVTIHQQRNRTLGNDEPFRKGGMYVRRRPRRVWSEGQLDPKVLFIAPEYSLREPF